MTLLTLLDQFFPYVGRDNHFKAQNGHQVVISCPYISVSEPRRGMIRVPMPMFLGVGIQYEYWTFRLCHLVLTAILNVKMVIK